MSCYIPWTDYASVMPSQSFTSLFSWREELTLLCVVVNCQYVKKRFYLNLLWISSTYMNGLNSCELNGKIEIQYCKFVDLSQAIFFQGFPQNSSWFTGLSCKVWSSCHSYKLWPKTSHKQHLWGRLSAAGRPIWNEMNQQQIAIK